MDELAPVNQFSMPVWKTYLYQLQLQAPKPKAIYCQKNVSSRPAYYGLEFHGLITRQECEQVLGNEDGNFVVRESTNPPGSCTLCIKFSNETKNYKVYYDGAFYVGEKRFDSIVDLVHDGMISFYIEKHASSYIADMAEENNYAESPYVASKTAFLARQKQNQEKIPSNINNKNSSQSIHASFQKQQQNIPQNFAKNNQYPLPNSHQQFQSINSHNNLQTNTFQQQLQHQMQSNQFIQHPSIDSTSSLIPENRNLNNNNSSKSNTIFDRFDIMNSEKPHRFKSQNFKGPHWCDFCLNFMWGLVSQGVECQDCGFQAHKKCSERAPQDCEPQMKFIKRVFGVDLTTLVKATSTIRPIVVEKCIEEIESRKGALESEGIYRVSGFSDAIDELKCSFDRGDIVDFNEFKYNDIHIICSLLKLYLRQLPIPLITFDIYNRLIDMIINGPNLIERIKACIIDLPPAHYLTLKYLIEHLVKVSRHSSKNHMSNENLSIVFGPTLMRSVNPDRALALKNTMKEQKLVEAIISNYSAIFDK